MTASDSDKELVERAKQGDLRAFDMLVLKYQRRVFRLVSRLIKNTSEVEDVSQETLIKAFRAIQQLRGDSAFYTWLYRIAENTAKNNLFSKGKRQRFGALKQPP